MAEEQEAKPVGPAEEGPGSPEVTHKSSESEDNDEEIKLLSPAAQKKLLAAFTTMKKQESERRERERYERSRDTDDDDRKMGRTRSEFSFGTPRILGPLFQERQPVGRTVTDLNREADAATSIQELKIVARRLAVEFERNRDDASSVSLLLQVTDSIGARWVRLDPNFTDETMRQFTAAAYGVRQRRGDELNAAANTASIGKDYRQRILLLRNSIRANDRKFRCADDGGAPGHDAANGSASLSRPRSSA